MHRRARAIVALLSAILTLSMVTVGVTVAQGPDEARRAEPKGVAKGEFDSYIVVLDADPLVITEGRNLKSERARSRAAALRASHAEVLEEAGISTTEVVSDYVNVLNGFSALITYEEAQRLAADPRVAVVLPDELLQPQTDSSPEFLGVDGGGGAWDSGITGRGVVVGIIDTGIWPEHPSFADNGLAEPPIDTSELPCEFGNTAHNRNDAAFTCNNKLIGARQMLDTYRALIGAEPEEFDSARDDDGHGTHTASTAAGNASVTAEIYGEGLGEISGIAPDAHVIAYKGLGDLGGFTSDLAAAIDAAVEDGVDVINYSIGGGASTLLGADDIAFLFAADAGVYVAASAGNSGPRAGTVGSPANMPWVTTVGASTQSRFFQGTLSLGNGSQYTGASITLEAVGSTRRGADGLLPLVDAANAGGDLCRRGELKRGAVRGAIVLCRRGEIARVEKSLAVQEAGGLGMIMYENDDRGNLFTDTHWVPTVHVDNAPGLAIKAYIASAGRDARAAIVDTRTVADWPSAPSMTSFSSRGPNIFGDILKPDVTAPGLQILAGASPFPDAGAVPGELFQAIAGTSMSSPHVAGLFALMAQAHPDWSAAAAKSAFMTTASQDVLDNDRVTPATPFGMGAGHVDPGRVDNTGSAFQPGLVYEAGFNEYLGFLCDASPSVFRNPEATCARLAGDGIPTDASDLNYPSISVAELAGSQTVTRTVTSVASTAQTYEASVVAPAGYTVTVSPSRITVGPGQSVDYQVTIVNNSATLDEWRFGSITWNERRGAYSVRSPLVVRATAFDAATHLTESGESGTTSFDVKFGYTGDYDATAHGLVAATVTTGNVLQDPDQQFDPSDVAAGGADLHEFTLTDAAVFRIAMPPEGTEADADVDVFVHDPAGNLVASSTAGGTNELITISDPDDGTWSVYLHGWSAPGGDSDYTMYSWVIPGEADAGSLQVTAEPESAVLGETGTVEVAWSGAAAGTWSFGAVSHLGVDGALLSRTLIEVDNR